MKDLMRAIRSEARAAGPVAVAELRAFDRYARETAEQLGAIIAQKKLSQREVGRRAKLAQPEVSKILSGKSNPRIRTVERLARALGAEIRVVPTTAARTARVKMLAAKHRRAASR
jgi:transcriptional regulator with XRE-family HTH domain